MCFKIYLYNISLLLLSLFYSRGRRKSNFLSDTHQSTAQIGMEEMCDFNLLSCVNGLEENLKYVVLSVGHNSLETLFFPSSFPK